MKRGDLYIAHPELRLARRHLISVTRVARDGTWADIAVRTWAVMWTKRQPLRDGAFGFPHEKFRPGSFSFAAQEQDHMRMLKEEPR